MAFKLDVKISRQKSPGREGCLRQGEELSTRSEVEGLMTKMKENPHEHKNISPHTMEGYLFVQEKRQCLAVYLAVCFPSSCFPGCLFPIFLFPCLSVSYLPVSLAVCFLSSCFPACLPAQPVTLPCHPKPLLLH